MINFIKNWYREFLKPMDIKYLDQACDLVDLEHRQQQLMRRQAPFQKLLKQTQYLRRNF